MVWRERKDHVTDCYFCLTKFKGYSAKSKHVIQYPNLPSAMQPVPHDGFAPPKPPTDWDIGEQHVEMLDSGNEAAASTSLNNPEYLPRESTSPHFIMQQELNDLVRDLNLSQTQSEFLASRLQGWNLLEKGAKVTSLGDTSVMKPYSLLPMILYAVMILVVCMKH